jgi:hypothetical protein
MLYLNQKEARKEIEILIHKENPSVQVLDNGERIEMIFKLPKHYRGYNEDLLVYLGGSLGFHTDYQILLKNEGPEFVYHVTIKSIEMEKCEFLVQRFVYALKVFQETFESELKQY